MEHQDQNMRASLPRLKFTRPPTHIIVIGIIALIVILALIFWRGLFVAANVNGVSISRISVIKELEKQGGQQALDALIQKKLIDTELKQQKIEVPQEEIDEEIKKIEAQLASQGGSLKEALETQNISEEKLRGDILVQKKVEKLLSDKTKVTEAEADAYIKESKLTPPKEMKMEDFKAQVITELQKQKFQEEAQKWASDLKASAKIKYFVSY